jgi:hypothetical protein
VTVQHFENGPTTFKIVSAPVAEWVIDETAASGPAPAPTRTTLLVLEVNHGEKVKNQIVRNIRRKNLVYEKRGPPGKR